MTDHPKLSVVALKTRVEEVQQSQIAALQTALEHARNGHFKAVAIVGVEHNGAIYSHISASDCAPTVVGGLVVAQRRVLDDMASRGGL